MYHGTYYGIYGVYYAGTQLPWYARRGNPPEKITFLRKTSKIVEIVGETLGTMRFLCFFDGHLWPSMWRIIGHKTFFEECPLWVPRLNDSAHIRALEANKNRARALPFPELPSKGANKGQSGFIQNTAVH